MRTISSQLGRLFRDLRKNAAGTAAIEFGVVASTLVMIMLNGVEIARYYYAKMELQNAVQTGGQAVWKLCDTTSLLPVATACTNMSTKLTSALQSTSLGNGVTLSSGFPTEGYRCINQGTGVLTTATSTAPSDCSSVGGRATESPGYYVTIQAQYTYAPLFTRITIGNSMPTTMTATSVTRLQ